MIFPKDEVIEKAYVRDYENFIMGLKKIPKLFGKILPKSFYGLSLGAKS